MTLLNFAVSIGPDLEKDTFTVAGIQAFDQLLTGIPNQYAMKRRCTPGEDQDYVEERSAIRWHTVGHRGRYGF
jgi:hypothetical protein